MWSRLRQSFVSWHFVKLYRIDRPARHIFPSLQSLLLSFIACLFAQTAHWLNYLIDMPHGPCHAFDAAHVFVRGHSRISLDQCQLVFGFLRVRAGLYSVS